jgi:hypothetical protein
MDGYSQPFPFDRKVFRHKSKSHAKPNKLILAFLAADGSSQNIEHGGLGSLRLFIFKNSVLSRHLPSRRLAMSLRREESGCNLDDKASVKRHEKSMLRGLLGFEVL